MNIVFCLLALFFALTGMMTRIGKGNFLMRGFVKDYDKKKQNFDEKLFNGFMAKIMYLCALAFAIMSLGLVLEIKAVTWVGIVIFFAVMVYSAKYTDNEAHFKRDTQK